jgi:hypothetical protein
MLGLSDHALRPQELTPETKSYPTKDDARINLYIKDTEMWDL